MPMVSTLSPGIFAGNDLSQALSVPRLGPKEMSFLPMGAPATPRGAPVPPFIPAEGPPNPQNIWLVPGSKLIFLMWQRNPKNDDSPRKSATYGNPQYGIKS